MPIDYALAACERAYHTPPEDKPPPQRCNDCQGWCWGCHVYEEAPDGYED